MDLTDNIVKTPEVMRIEKIRSIYIEPFWSQIIAHKDPQTREKVLQEIEKEFKDVNLTNTGKTNRDLCTSGLEHLGVRTGDTSQARDFTSVRILRNLRGWLSRPPENSNLITNMIYLYILPEEKEFMREIKEDNAGTFTPSDQYMRDNDGDSMNTQRHIALAELPVVLYYVQSIYSGLYNQYTPTQSQQD